MILLLDNFDSFTYNLVDYFLQLDARLEVLRNDVKLAEIKQLPLEAIVISPGPETPEQAGVLMETIDYYHDKLPMLGICLGHQALGMYFGSQLVQAGYPMHGKISEVHHEQRSIFNQLPSPLNVVRYHSLILDRLPDDLEVTATTSQKEVMALQHKQLPITGIQFHPEAALTESGLRMLSNWMEMALD